MRATLPVVLLLMAGPLHGQQRSLERADSLLLAGDYAQARSALGEWQRANPIGAPADAAARARALYLNGRLSSDAAEAQDLYLSLVLSYPTARDAPDALLRLGQSFLADGEPAKAQAYLQRLVNDYPSATNRMLGYLWLARAQAAAGAPAAACTTAAAALRVGAPNDELGALLQTEEKESCAAAERRAQPQPAQPRPAPPRAETARAAPRPAARPPATADSRTRYALQAGAFREARSATALAAELRRKGFEARIVYLPGSDLARVRVGRFASADAANQEARRLTSAGVRTIVVSDVVNERAQR